MRRSSGRGIGNEASPSQLVGGICPEIHYGGGNLRDFGGKICEFLVDLCARQLGILSEFDKLMEECCWHDPFDPLEHRWDESLLMNSTGIDEVDEYANELMEELVKDFAFEGAPNSPRRCWIIMWKRRKRRRSARLEYPILRRSRSGG